MSTKNTTADIDEKFVRLPAGTTIRNRVTGAPLDSGCRTERDFTGFAKRSIVSLCADPSIVWYRIYDAHGPDIDAGTNAVRAALRAGHQLEADDSRRPVFGRLGTRAVVDQQARRVREVGGIVTQDKLAATVTARAPGGALIFRALQWGEGNAWLVLYSRDFYDPNNGAPNEAERRQEFLNGFARGAGIDQAQAAETWARWSDHLTTERRARVEIDGGEDEGFTEGGRWRRNNVKSD